ncbi:hypothetical protein [Desulfatirhabdium butyrativorans]|uniref:hypothetical protein n=1 Tax=Desulfatirhabdium butyrativorans TaxID=340467 RepID=UPI0012EC40A5|nr:hypothetical protein [Desulfatirhabdium butyrativorans]
MKSRLTRSAFVFVLAMVVGIFLAGAPSMAGVLQDASSIVVAKHGGHGPGDGTGNGGNGPKDGTGNGAKNGSCSLQSNPSNDVSLLAGKGKGNMNGPGDGTGNGGNGPKDGTGNGKGSC